jgi:hypothetical protein
VPGKTGGVGVNRRCLSGPEESGLGGIWEMEVGRGCLDGFGYLLGWIEVFCVLGMDRMWRG